MRMIAAFLSPEALQEVLKNIQGDANEQNIGDALKKMYMDELEKATDPFLYTLQANPLQGEEVDGPNEEGVFVFCHVPGSESRNLGRAIAASLGFVRDFCQEDSWHGVLFL